MKYFYNWTRDSEINSGNKFCICDLTILIFFFYVGTGRLKSSLCMLPIEADVPIEGRCV